MTNLIDFDKPVAELRRYRDDLMEEDDSISSGHKQEAAYHMVSVLLGIQRFFNSDDFDEKYILEHLVTLHQIIQAYVHDRQLPAERFGKTPWSRTQ